MDVTLKKFVQLRERLVKEKAELEKRLTEINEALGMEAEAPAVSERPASKQAAAKAPAAGGKKRGRRTANSISLKEAVLQVLKEGSLTKQEILQSVERLGYKFNTSNPMNSLGVILYGKKPKFKNQDGKFSVA
jgi:hypothetical protein